MDFVVHKMVEFQHIHGAHRNLTVKRFSGAPVVEGGLSGTMNACFIQKDFNFILFGTVEYRRGHMDTVLVFLCKTLNFVFFHFVDHFVGIRACENPLHLTFQITDLVGFQHLVDLIAKALCRPAQMNFENLPDIHTRWNAQGIQDHIHRSAILKIGHILLGKNPGYHPLVSMPACHFIPYREFPFHGHIDFHQLNDPRW